MLYNTSYNSYMMFVDEWSRVVKNFSELIAIRFNDTNYTYRQVDELSDLIAINLVNKGITNGDVIGIYMDKSEMPIITMIAALKCGSTYVPLSKLYPKQKIEKILNCANVKLVICEDYNDIIPDNLQCLYKNLIIAANQTIQNINVSNEVAYILFTSGTTGEPKGVSIRYSSIANLVNDMKDWFAWKKVNRQHVVGLFAPLIFDISVGQIYFSLLTGNICEVIPDAIKENTVELIEYLQVREVETIDMTPTYIGILERFVELENKKISYPHILVSCGEKLPLDIAKNYFNMYGQEDDVVLINAYGPTETCVYASKYIITKQNIGLMDKMVIGEPIQNTGLYILDEDRNECRQNEEGELYISGAGLSTGYLNQPELTQKCFVESEKGLLYKTGDRALLNSNNEIEILGRIDSQVKLHGYRIELGEIEAALRQIEEIDDARVCITNERDNSILIAYFTAEQIIALQNIHKQLKAILPTYMIPAFFVKVDKFPMTSSGKLDMKALPDYKKHYLKEDNRTEVNSDEQEHLTEISNLFLELCKEYLYIEDINIYDNFFNLGGDSLTLYMMNLRLWNLYNLSLDFNQFYSCLNIKEMIELIYRELDEKEKSNIKEDKKEIIQNNVTPFQWYIIRRNSRMEKQTIENAPKFPFLDLVYTVSPDVYLEEDRIKNALQTVIQNNEMLRTTFVKNRLNYLMNVESEGVNPFIKKYVNKFDDSLFERDIKKFDISKLPLFQFILYETSDKKQVILLHFHHTIFDYGSLHVFLDQLFQAYDNKVLKEKTVDYLVYQEGYTERSTRNKTFWVNYMKNRPDMLHTTGDPDSIQGKLSGYGTKIYMFDKEVCDQIKYLGKKYKTTQYNILLFALALYFAIYKDRNDFTIGTTLNGRSGGRYFYYRFIY